MTDQDDDQIQKELRNKQRFSMAGAIGRAASGAMKGASPIPLRDQAIHALCDLVDQQLRDPSGALKSMLKRRIKNNGPLVDQHLEDPPAALVAMIQEITGNETVLHEFVRQVDVKWGQLFMERPHFQQPGQAPHPDDEYTHASVKKDLEKLLAAITPS